MALVVNQTTDCQRNASSVYVLFLIFSVFIGCVPTPDENASIPPKITDLRPFFIPQKTGQSYLWHFFSSLNDSAYFLNYVGAASGATSEGYSPVSLLQYSDTLRKDSLGEEVYISDTLVEYYFGKSGNPLTPRLTLLHDTLRVGANWISSNNFITSNGAPVEIKAQVQDYYTAYGKYNDVFWVSYTSTVKGSQIPDEAHYKNGAHLDRYYARNIGEILETCKDAHDSTVWTNEFVETRPH